MIVNNQWLYGPVLWGILAGAGLLGLGAVIIAVPNLFGTPEYHGWRRPTMRHGEDQPASVLASPDSVLESFAGGLEEMWVPIPLIMWVVLIGVPIWLVVYLILYWMNDA